MIDIENMEELGEIGFKVDILPDGLKNGIIFQMNGLNFLHIREKMCIIVRLEDEHIEIFKA